MYHNFQYFSINEALPALLERLDTVGAEVGTRQGSRTKELTHVGVTLLSPRDRYIKVPGRKANLAAQIAETMWVLTGRDDIAWLKHYLPRAEDFSDDGLTWRGGYGPRLRKWGGWPHQNDQGAIGKDQIRGLFDLLKEDPITRRAVATIWDPAKDLVTGNRAYKDIPCNNWLHFTSRLGALDLHVATRSNDIWWGWSGVNVFEWSALQEILAGMLGVETGALHFSITSLHLYDQHWRRSAQLQEVAPIYTGASVRPGPRFDASAVGHDWAQLDTLLDLWMATEKYIRTGDPHAEVAVNTFPEPMLKSWLRVLQWWWSGDRSYLEAYRDTDLWDAVNVSLQPKRDTTPVPDPEPEAVAKPTAVTWESLAVLHAEKHAAYGDSWKRRGEMLGILANIARKVDRLTGGKETSDETAIDTAADLLIYAIKYRLWLLDNGVPSVVSDTENLRTTAEPERVGKVLKWTLTGNNAPLAPASLGIQNIVDRINTTFDLLEQAVRDEDSTRWRLVDGLISQAAVALRTIEWHAGNATRSWKGYGN